MKTLRIRAIKRLVRFPLSRQKFQNVKLLRAVVSNRYKVPGMMYSLNTLGKKYVSRRAAPHRCLAFYTNLVPDEQGWWHTIPLTVLPNRCLDMPIYLKCSKLS